MGEKGSVTQKVELTPATVVASWIERHVPNLFILLLALTYLFGYVITSIFYRSLGIQSVSLLKAQFIETGFIFIFIAICFQTVLAVVPPLVALSRHKAGLSSSGGGKVIGLIANFIIILLFFSIFATKHELRADVSMGLLSMSARHWLLLYLIILVPSLLAAGGIERAIKNGSLRKNLWTKNLAGLIRILLFLVSLLMDVVTYRCAPWLGDAFLSSVFYLLVMAALCVSGSRILNSVLSKDVNSVGEEREAMRSSKWGKAYYAVFWPSRESQSGRTARFKIVAGVYLLLLVYLLLTAYTYTVFRFLPESRGGALPVVQSTFVIKGVAGDRLRGLLVPQESGSGDATTRMTKPLYLIEQGGDDIFVTEHYAPFTDTEHGSAPVYRIRKEDVSTIEHDTINLR